MNKITIPALLVATIMVAGAFAFVPVEQASTVHLSGTVVAVELGDVNGLTGLQISADGVIVDEDDATVVIGEQLTVTAGDATGNNVFTGLFVDVVDTDGAGADNIASQIVLRTETETAGTDEPVAWIIGTATDATAATVDSTLILQTAANSVATTAVTFTGANTVLAGTLGVGAITSTGALQVTGAISDSTATVTLADTNVAITGATTVTGTLIVTDVLTSTAANANPIVLEGATADAFETTIALVDPTADRTATFPDITGTVLTQSGSRVTTAGATVIDIDQFSTEWTTTGAATATLADGVPGQLIYLVLVVDAGDQVVTPTTLAAGTTLTFADALDAVLMVFETTVGWTVITNVGAVAIA